MSQYDIDNRGEFAKLFQAIRNILLSYPNITEVKNAKQTSYRDEYSMVVMLRGRGDVFVMAFGKGAKLQEKYPHPRGHRKDRTTLVSQKSRGSG
jgi:hypothetical protein